MRGDVGIACRLRFTKLGRVRFVSHRDVARAFERAFRIAQLPLAFTGGFSPRPQVSFGYALAVGHESEAEYLDLRLTGEIDPEDLAERVNSGLPNGIEVTGSAMLVERAPSLQEAVTAMSYTIEALAPPEASREELLARGAADAAALLAADRVEAMCRRKGQVVSADLRPAICRLEALRGSERGVVFSLDLSTAAPGARPAEVLGALATDWVEGTVRRTHQWIERDGARREPLDADARPRAEARVS